MSSKPWFVFAGGGTGGHLFPALSVVEALQTGGEPADVAFFCTQRPIDAEILGRAGVEAVPQVVRPMPARLWGIPGFLLRWRQAVGACMIRFSRRRPAAVVGAGGYASGPPVEAALRLGIPAFLLNPDAVPGKANRHMARRGISGIFVQWEVSRQHFPSRAPIHVTGCPVRAAFRARLAEGAARPAARAGALASFGLDADRPMLLVTGASQGARTINEAVLALAAQVAGAGWQILHLSGQADLESVTRGYAEVAAGRAGFRYQVLAFTDRMPEAMAAADLIISRAGASSLAEIQAVGKPSILFPYPYHKDRHQWHNAEVLVQAQAAELIDDHKDAAANARDLAPVLGRLLADGQLRERMGQAALALDHPTAGADIAARLRPPGAESGRQPSATPSVSALAAG